jgi:hypothetical protein
MKYFKTVFLQIGSQKTSGMKKIFPAIIYFVAIIISINPAYAQKEFNLPDNIALKDKEDYAKYENLVIQAAIWLENTDMDKDPDKRKKVDAFIIKWVAGTPAFTLNLDYPAALLTDRNPELLSLYIASYARNILEDKKESGNFTATKAALKSISHVYKKGIDVARNKELEKMCKFTTEAEWDDYIIRTMKIPQT